MITSTNLFDKNQLLARGQTKDKRLEALEMAERLELPKVEKMNLAKWSLDQYGTYTNQTPIVPESIKEMIANQKADQGLIVQLDSGTVYQKWTHDQGVIFCDLETAFASHSELISEHFSKVIAMDENRLTALHHALWSGGVFLYVPKGIKVTVPFQGVFALCSSQAVFAPHILIVADQGSEVTFVDHSFSDLSLKAPIVHNKNVEIVAKDQAKVTYGAVHHFEEHITDVTVRRALIGKDACVNWIIGEMNEGNTLVETMSRLDGQGSLTDMKVVHVGAGKQYTHLTTRAVHFGKNSDSQMLTRAVMKDEATSIVNGITKIEHGATRSNGQQTEKVLMLSPKSRGDANPILLIDENDVTAGHAASAGQVNEEHIYYLMSRGISKAEAEKLIIHGFLEPIVAEIPLEDVKQRLAHVLEGRLRSGAAQS